MFADDTFYCSAKAGFIPGPNGGIYASTVETQVRQTMRNLLDGLEEAGLALSNVVATNVYLDDINDFPRMNRIYAQYFPEAPPARMAFRAWAENLKISGLRGGTSPRIFVGGTAYQKGDLINPQLGIVFEEYNDETRTIVFRDKTGARVERRN